MRIALLAPYPRYDSLEDFCRTFSEVKRVYRPDELEEIDFFEPDYVFVPHWHWKIPKDVYDIYETIIFHMTDLPYGRGGSPLKNLLVRDFKWTKLSAFRCVDEMDAGPIYLKLPLSLEGSENEIMDRCVTLMKYIIIVLVNNRIEPKAQVGEPTYFKRMK